MTIGHHQQISRQEELRQIELHIRKTYEKLTQGAHERLMMAKEIGMLLHKVFFERKLVKRNERTKWAKKEFGISKFTSRNYRLIYEHWELVRADANMDEDFGIEDALGVIHDHLQNDQAISEERSEPDESEKIEEVQHEDEEGSEESPPAIEKPKVIPKTIKSKKEDLSTTAQTLLTKVQSNKNKLSEGQKLILIPLRNELNDLDLD